MKGTEPGVPSAGHRTQSKKPQVHFCRAPRTASATVTMGGGTDGGGRAAEGVQQTSETLQLQVRYVNSGSAGGRRWLAGPHQRQENTVLPKRLEPHLEAQPQGPLVAGPAELTQTEV